MIRYDRSIGANVYDPSGGPNEADQGNAMQALARALGFYNEASDLGTAANFGNPQQAAAVLGQLFQGEQAKLDRQNKLNALAMQQSGQAAIQEARLNQAAQEAAANRDMTRWGKEGDWQRYDKQFATQLAKSQQEKMADFFRAMGLEQGREKRSAASDQARIRAAEIGAGAKQNVAETQAGARRDVADTYGRTRVNVAEIGAGAKRDVATTQAEARKYGYDRGLEGVLARADAYLEANRYRADRGYEGQDLVSGRRLEGEKYRADRGYEGRTDVANINAQARERAVKAGGSGGGQNFLKIQADLEKKRADILSKQAPKLQNRNEKIRERLQYARSNNVLRADGKPLTLADVANYVDAEHDRAWKAQQQTAIEQIDLRLKELGPTIGPVEQQFDPGY